MRIVNWLAYLIYVWYVPLESKLLGIAVIDSYKMVDFDIVCG